MPTLIDTLVRILVSLALGWFVVILQTLWGAP